MKPRGHLRRIKVPDLYMPVLIGVLMAGVLWVGGEVRRRDAQLAELGAGSTANLESRAQRAALSPPAFQTHGLIVPVAGVSRQQLNDTWGAARAQGRTHEGIDIMAPEGAIVRAAADGRVVRFFDSVRGGITVYQVDAARRYVFYYAHLQRRAPGLAEGDEVRQGQVIGFVGETGNAPTPHLHFEIQRLGEGRQWWRATSVNPYPYLLAGEAPR